MLYLGATQSHHGAYRCKAWNQAAEVSRLGYLRVNSRPTVSVNIHGSSHFVVDGTVNISCHVRGYPLFKIQEPEFFLKSDLSGVKRADVPENSGRIAGNLAWLKIIGLRRSNMRVEGPIVREVFNSSINKPERTSKMSPYVGRYPQKVRRGLQALVNA
ncbi:unnamed protein product [Protopolystoma xenopodis]|uniref:Ig-like domain-containing protein n=1 Tax=Protopolystoma xenopodis TaxID=117903 RepID=A0A448X352_9PLAT|nr:unnamed protein product [Protopolystoma xenopodis]